MLLASHSRFPKDLFYTFSKTFWPTGYAANVVNQKANPSNFANADQADLVQYSRALYTYSNTPLNC